MTELNDTQEPLQLPGQFIWDPIEELELKVSRSDKEDYAEIVQLLTQVLTYHSTQAAEIHMNSDRLGTYDLKEKLDERIDKEGGSFISKSNLEFCSCCGFVRQIESLSIFTHLRSINNIGISTYLYFQTIKNLAILLTILSLVYSIYALATNLLASGVINAKGEIDPSYANSYNGLSLGSKQLNHEDFEANAQFYRMQCWIGLGVMVIWFFMFFILKYFEKYEEERIEEETISASDFTVCMENIPKDIKQESLQESLDTYFSTINNVPEELKKPFNIKKFNVGTPFYLNENDLKDNELEKLKKRREKLLKEFIDLIKERQESTSFRKSKEEREEMYKEFYENSIKQIQKYSELSQKITNAIQCSSKNNEEATTTVFVTFESSNAVKLMTSLNETSFLTTLKYLFSCCQSENTFRYYEGQTRYNVKIRRAPEPEDIVWSNIGVSECEKFKRKFITFFTTLIVLGISFAIVYALSQAQQNDPTNQVLSFAISIIISAINIILGCNFKNNLVVIRKLSAYEKNFTETDHQASLAVKAIFASLINSILIPVIVNRFIKRNIYQENGLASDVFMLGITNSFLTPTLKLIDPNYIINRLLKWKASWPSKCIYNLDSRLSMTQQELNASYSFMIFEVGYEYVYMVSLFLFTCFFVSLQPIISFFAVMGLSMMYWTQKNSLFNRMRRPIPGTDIVNLSMFQLIICGGVLYCLGSLTWSNFLPEGTPKDAMVPNLIALGVSILMVIMPYNQILQLCKGADYSKNMEYEKNRILLPSEYDRLNPATSKEGLAEFQKFYEEEMKKILKSPEAERNSLFAEFTKQGARGYHNSQGGVISRNSLGAMFLPLQHFIQQNQEKENTPESTSTLLKNLQGTMNQNPPELLPNLFYQLSQKPKQQQGEQEIHHQMGRHPSFHILGIQNAFHLQDQTEFENPYFKQQNVGLQSYFIELEPQLKNFNSHPQENSQKGANVNYF